MMKKLITICVGSLLLTSCHSFQHSEYTSTCVVNEQKVDNKLQNGFYALDKSSAFESNDVIIEQLTDDKKVLVPIDDIISIESSKDELGATLNIVLNRDGSQKMMEHTRGNIGSSIAFIINDQVISNARILAVLTSSFRLTGLDVEQAQNIESMFTCE